MVRSNTSLLLLQAVEDGDFPRVKQIVHNNNGVLSERDEAGITPILKAAATNQLNILRWLIDAGCSTAEVDSFSNSVLLWAAWKGNLGVVQWLISNGLSDPELEANEAGQTALLQAAAGGHLETVQWLLDCEGGSKNKADRLSKMRDKSGKTALIWAAANGHLPVVQWLATEAGFPAYQSDDRGTSTLHWAAWRRQFPVLQWLVGQLGEDAVVRPDSQGDTCLSRAAAVGDLQMVKWLCLEDGTSTERLSKRGIKLLTHTNKEGNGPLFWAAQHCQLKVVDWLLLDAWWLLQTQPIESADNEELLNPTIDESAIALTLQEQECLAGSPSTELTDHLVHVGWLPSTSGTTTPPHWTPSTHWLYPTVFHIFCVLAMWCLREHNANQLPLEIVGGLLVMWASDSFSPRLLLVKQ
eukprot:TRINITY_DN53697_c0_g1_i2.p1 TRINITY_DN53697_c0_g1~~TRINITY_DN53697_c0_g1_i2.p1  ORF type:complete len:411 (-),score=45.71 TRINITY_DN53697_c0_g1_i2:116-1348(-)